MLATLRIPAGVALSLERLSHADQLDIQTADLAPRGPRRDVGRPRRGHRHRSGDASRLVRESGRGSADGGRAEGRAGARDRRHAGDARLHAAHYDRGGGSDDDRRDGAREPRARARGADGGGIHGRRELPLAPVTGEDARPRPCDRRAPRPRTRPLGRRCAEAPRTRPSALHRPTDVRARRARHPRGETGHGGALHDLGHARMGQRRARAEPGPDRPRRPPRLRRGSCRALSVGAPLLDLERAQHQPLPRAAVRRAGSLGRSADVRGSLSARPTRGSRRRTRMHSSRSARPARTAATLRRPVPGRTATLRHGSRSFSPGRASSSTRGRTIRIRSRRGSRPTAPGSGRT